VNGQQNRERWCFDAGTNLIACRVEESRSSRIDWPWRRRKPRGGRGNATRSFEGRDQTLLTHVTGCISSGWGFGGGWHQAWTLICGDDVMQNGKKKWRGFFALSLKIVGPKEQVHLGRGSCPHSFLRSRKKHRGYRV
jgi:hypothetical protein